MAAAYCHTKAGVFRSMLRTPGMRREEREIEQLARERLSFFGERLMGYRWDQPAYSLSYANRRRLEIARATATNPRILLLDEPAAGMNPKETHEITELIAKLREDGGYTILVIEHDMHVVEGISDRVDRARPRRQDRRRARTRRWRRTRRSSRPTSGSGRRSANERRAQPARARRGRHLLRADPHPAGALDHDRAGRARLPARRQRVGQVDDAEDDPRHRPAAQRRRCASTGRT